MATYFYSMKQHNVFHTEKAAATKRRRSSIHPKKEPSLLLSGKLHDREPLEVDDELEVGRVREQVDWDDPLRDEGVALVDVGRQLTQVHEVLHGGLRVAADVDQALNSR